MLYVFYPLFFSACPAANFWWVQSRCVSPKSGRAHLRVSPSFVLLMDRSLSGQFVSSGLIDEDDKAVLPATYKLPLPTYINVHRKHRTPKHWSPDNAPRLSIARSTSRQTMENVNPKVPARRITKGQRIQKNLGEGDRGNLAAEKNTN